MSPADRSAIPDLSSGILSALSKLFLAESEMVAVEKAIAEKSASFTHAKITGIYKDVMNKLDEAFNFFNSGLEELSSGAKSGFRKYILAYCQAMKAS